MSVEKKKKSKNKRKTKKKYTLLTGINKILLTIIITVIVVFILINLGQIFNSLSSSEKNDTTDATSDENLIIETYTDDTDTTPPKDELTQEMPEESQDSTQTEQTPQEITEEPIPPASMQDESEPADNTTTLTVYFVQIGDNEKVSIVARPRVVEKTPAILTRTIEKLLEGPTEEEQASGLQDFIPENTKLNRISVTNSVAFLDFNEAFQFNEFGTAGILAQLYQIVYTCTEIPLINAVQITIDNQQVKYLGGEGIIEVSTPLTRAYLNTF